ncbi:MAG: hypothetical protein E7128_05200 [Rikenellaceae bacterium]|nr:hypothetical protein [Rikenellaceae bacterium]
MKKYLVMLLSATVLLFGCEEPTGGTQEEAIQLDKTALSFDAVDALPQDVACILTNCSEITAIPVEEWCTAEVTYASGSAMIRVSVEDNAAEESRSTQIYVSGSTVTEYIDVTQLGLEPALSVAPSNFEVAAEGESVAVVVTSNVEYTIDSDEEWISWEVSENGTITVAVEANTETEERTATLEVENLDYNLKAEVKITQAAAEAADRVRDTDDYFVPYTSLTYGGDIRPGYPIENAWDNNLETYWSCPNSGIKGTAELVFNFDGRYRLDYMDYYPSPDYGQWGEFTVKYKTKKDYKYTEVGTFDFGMKDGKQTLTFEESLVGVTELVIEVKSAKGRSITTGLLAGAAEIEFFYSSDELYNPLELFTDESCSEFKNPNFSEADLDKIKNEDLRYVAEIMLQRTEKDNEFRVATYPTYPNPDLDAAKYHTSTYTRLDNVTGILFDDNKTYTVCVADDGREDVNPRLVVVNYKYPYKDYSNRHPGHFNAVTRSYNLKTGINKITIDENVPDKEWYYGGLAYIEYFSVVDVNVKINFVDGEVNGYYDTEMHEPERFSEFISNSQALQEKTGVAAHLDLRSPEVVLTMGSDLLMQHTQTGERAERLMQLHDSIVWLEEQLQGHHLFNTGAHANRMRMVGRYGGSYMYAGSYETGYDVSGFDCARSVCDPDYVKRDSWGMAHEMGHVNQVRNGLKWVGTSEVTNNICSAYVNWKFLGETRLKQNPVHVGYIGAFSDIMARGCPHVLVGSWDEAYYLKVVPFWQLYLYFTEVKGMTEFYPTIYNTIRNYSDCETMSDEEAMCRFCELVSDVTKLDMTEFFERWGFLDPIEGMWFNDYGKRQVWMTSERINKAREHMSQYPKPEQPIWFITEFNIDRFKNPAPVKVGTAAVNKAKDTYRFSDWENCVAYVVEGSDGEWYAVMDAAYANSVKTAWHEFYWAPQGSEGSASNENSEINYCTAGKHEVVKTPSNTPALKSAKCYGVGADGTFYLAK